MKTTALEQVYHPSKKTHKEWIRNEKEPLFQVDEIDMEALLQGINAYSIRPRQATPRHATPCSPPPAPLSLEEFRISEKKFVFFTWVLIAITGKISQNYPTLYPRYIFQSSAQCDGFRHAKLFHCRLTCSSSHFCQADSIVIDLSANTSPVTDAK